MRRAPLQITLNTLLRLPSENVALKQSHNFLIDTGAAVSVLPISKFPPDQHQDGPSQLFTASQQPMKTYGTKTLSFRLKDVDDIFCWKFIVTDVSEGIIGADFLAHHELLVDCSRGRVYKMCTANAITHATFPEALCGVVPPAVVR